MMRALIADDEPIARRRLASLLRSIPNVELLGAAADGVQAAEMIAEHQPDLVVLDIEMPGRSGLDLAGALQGPGAPVVVFVTAFARYAPKAFDIEAADYLLKPVMRDRLAQAMRRADQIRRRRAVAAGAPLLQTTGPDLADGRPNALWAPIRGGRVRLSAADILWIEGARDYAILHTAARSHMLRTALGTLQDLFSPQLIRRTHRSFLVNLGEVHEIRHRTRGDVSLVLRDGSETPVGPSYAAEVMAALQFR